MEATRGIQFDALSPSVIVNGYEPRADWPAALHIELGDLVARRSRFSKAHELAHHVFVGANSGGMSAVVELFRVIGGLVTLNYDVALQAHLAKPFKAMAAAPPVLGHASIQPSPDSRLPSWQWEALSMSALSVRLTRKSAAPAAGDPRLSTAASHLHTFIEQIASLIVDAAKAAICWIDQRRAVIYARLARRHVPPAEDPGVRAFVLVLLAVYRRHGRRSEPDDHAALPMRRYPTSQGAAACA
jgi:hypothetical protein